MSFKIFIFQNTKSLTYEHNIDIEQTFALDMVQEHSMLMNESSPKKTLCELGTRLEEQLDFLLAGPLLLPRLV